MDKRRAMAAMVFAALLICSALANGATITVNSAADSGGICPGPTCTLRQAIFLALPGDTIDFNPSLTTIDLTTAELLVDKSLTITGPGPASLKIRRANANDGSATFRIFHVVAGNFNVTLSGVTIADGFQIGLGENGGGILLETGNTLTVTNCGIAGNTVGVHGGGIYNRGTVTISDSTISGNRAGHGWNGAGLYNAGTMTITNSTISGNSISGGNGGGLLNAAGGMVTIANSTISGNSLGQGGGAGILNDGGTVAITNSTMSENATTNFVPTLGGDLANSSGTVSLRNTIVASSSSGASGGPDVGGSITSQGYNLIGNNGGATIAPIQSTDQIGTSASPINPGIGPLQDNGGPTFTHAVLSGSRARDKGHSSGRSSDQRGLPRPVDNPIIPNAAGGDGSDIGAFEMEGALIARSSNISTRSRVQTGDNVMIGGFIITGDVPKPVVLRGLGPSLVGAGVPASAVLTDPVLELRGASGALITSNDDWKQSPQRNQIEGTVFEPENDREAVILATLPPAGYTTVVRGKESGTGVGLVEIYDLDTGSDSTLANISSRAVVETGNNVLIGGFTLGGSSGSPQIIIRAIGPSLGPLGVSNPLPDPTVELRDANAMLLASNDDWRDDAAQASYLEAVGLQPQHDLESALAATLPPGAYTAIVSGKNGETGVALVEVYNLQ